MINPGQSFFAAREFTDLDDLNEQARQWCTGLAADLPCPEDPGRKVREVFVEEKPLLLDLPGRTYDPDERVVAIVRKQPYVRFDLNDYSIPHDRIRRTLEVRANLKTVRIFDGTEQIAHHPRSFNKGDQIELPSHIDGLREYKRKAKSRSILDHLYRAAPSTADLLADAAKNKKSLRQMLHQLRQLLDAYGPEKLEHAICQAIENGTPHIGAVQQILETDRQARGQPPPVVSGVSKDPRVRDLTVHSHDLQDYDQLTEVSHDSENQ